MHWTDMAIYNKNLCEDDVVLTLYSIIQLTSFRFRSTTYYLDQLSLFLSMPNGLLCPSAK